MGIKDRNYLRDSKSKFSRLDYYYNPKQFRQSNKSMENTSGQRWYSKYPIVKFIILLILFMTGMVR